MSKKTVEGMKSFQMNPSSTSGRQNVTVEGVNKLLKFDDSVEPTTSNLFAVVSTAILSVCSFQINPQPNELTVYPSKLEEESVRTNLTEKAIQMAVEEIDMLHEQAESYVSTETRSLYAYEGNVYCVSSETKKGILFDSPSHSILLTRNEASALIKSGTMKKQSATIDENFIKEALTEKAHELSSVGRRFSYYTKWFGEERIATRIIKEKGHDVGRKLKDYRLTVQVMTNAKVAELVRIYLVKMRPDWHIPICSTVEEVLTHALAQRNVNKFQAMTAYVTPMSPLRGRVEEWQKAIHTYVRQGVLCEDGHNIALTDSYWWFYRLTCSYKMLIEHLDKLDVHVSSDTRAAVLTLQRGAIPSHVQCNFSISCNEAALTLSDALVTYVFDNHRDLIERALDARQLSRAADKALTSNSVANASKCSGVADSSPAVSPPSGQRLPDGDSEPQTEEAMSTTKKAGQVSSSKSKKRKPAKVKKLSLGTKGSNGQSETQEGTTKGANTSTPSSAKAKKPSVETKGSSGKSEQSPEGSTKSAKPSTKSLGTGEKIERADLDRNKLDPKKQAVCSNVTLAWADIPTHLCLYDSGSSVMLNGNPKIWQSPPVKVDDPMWIEHKGIIHELTHQGSVRLCGLPNGHDLVIENVWEYPHCDRITKSSSRLRGHPGIYFGVGQQPNRFQKWQPTSTWLSGSPSASTGPDSPPDSCVDSLMSQRLARSVMEQLFKPTYQEL